MLFNCPLLNPSSWVSIFDKISCEDHYDTRKICHSWPVFYLPLHLVSPTLSYFCTSFAAVLAVITKPQTGMYECMSHWTCFIFRNMLKQKPFRLKWLHDPESYGLQGIYGRKGWFIPSHRSLPTKNMLTFRDLFEIWTLLQKNYHFRIVLHLLLGC